MKMSGKRVCSYLLVIGCLSLATAPEIYSRSFSPVAAQLEFPTGRLPPGVDPVQAGQSLAAELRSLVPVEDSRFTGRLNIREPGRVRTSVPVVVKTTVQGAQWQVVYETSGPGQVRERLTIAHAPGQPTVYWYAHGQQLDAPIRLTGDQAAMPFAGSDFWLLDLGLEFFHWPQQRLLKYEMRRGRSTRVLESINPRPSPVGYARVVSWIDVESGGLLMAEAYDAQGRMLKEFKVDSLRKVQGKWQVKDMEIRNVQAKTATKLEFNLDRDSP